jgi:hypothetical protein
MRGVWPPRINYFFCDVAHNFPAIRCITYK